MKITKKGNETSASCWPDGEDKTNTEKENEKQKEKGKEKEEGKGEGEGEGEFSTVQTIVFMSQLAGEVGSKQILTGKLLYGVRYLLVCAEDKVVLQSPGESIGGIPELPEDKQCLLDWAVEIERRTSCRLEARKFVLQCIDAQLELLILFL